MSNEKDTLKEKEKELKGKAIHMSGSWSIKLDSGEELPMSLGGVIVKEDQPK